MMRGVAAVMAVLVAGCSPSDGGGAGPTAATDARGSDARETPSDTSGTTSPDGVVDTSTDVVEAIVDDDFDGVDDTIDNCVGIFNPNQNDSDRDELGDLCDPEDDALDSDGDTIPDEFDPFPADGARPGIVTSTTVYAHTSDELYYLDIKSGNVYLVDAFEFPSGSLSTEMTDIAIDRYGVMYGISFDDVFVIHPGTAECWRLSTLPKEFNGLTLIPRESIGDTRDAMIGVANDGTWWRMTLVPGLPGTGAQVSLTAFGAYGSSWGSSGDAFSIAGVGTFASVDTGSNDRDVLVRVDPTNGAVLSQVAPIGQYTQVWGLAGWTERVYGFEASGRVLVIDLATGAILSEKNHGKAWWGAGVKTVIDE